MAKKYYLPKSIVREATDKSRNANFKNDYIEFSTMIAESSGAAAEVLSGSYAVIKDLADNSRLTAGGRYIINDFTTVMDQPISLATITGEVEALMLTASSTSTFSPDAYSQSYPDDIIIFDINYDTTPRGATAKGKILYREDPNIAVSYPGDWRNIKFRLHACNFWRYGFNSKEYASFHPTQLESGIIEGNIGGDNSSGALFESIRYLSDIIDSSDYQDFYVFGDKDATHFKNVSIIPFSWYTHVSAKTLIDSAFLYDEYPAFVFKKPISASYLIEDFHIKGSWSVFGRDTGNTPVKHVENTTFYFGYYASIHDVYNEGIGYDRNIVTSTDFGSSGGSGTMTKTIIFHPVETTFTYSNEANEGTVFAHSIVRNTNLDLKAIVKKIDTSANTITISGNYTWTTAHSVESISCEVSWNGAGTNAAEIRRGDILRNTTKGEGVGICEVDAAYLRVDKDVTNTRTDGKEAWAASDVITVSQKVFSETINTITKEVWTSPISVNSTIEVGELTQDFIADAFLANSVIKMGINNFHSYELTRFIAERPIRGLRAMDSALKMITFRGDITDLKILSNRTMIARTFFGNIENRLVYLMDSEFPTIIKDVDGKRIGERIYFETNPSPPATLKTVYESTPVIRVYDDHLEYESWFDLRNIKNTSGTITTRLFAVPLLEQIEIKCEVTFTQTQGAGVGNTYVATLWKVFGSSGTALTDQTGTAANVLLEHAETNTTCTVAIVNSADNVAAIDVSTTSTSNHMINGKIFTKIKRIT